MDFGLTSDLGRFDSTLYSPIPQKSSYQCQVGLTPDDLRSEPEANLKAAESPVLANGKEGARRLCSCRSLPAVFSSTEDIALTQAGRNIPVPYRALSKVALAE